jgi:hypothetical protein
MTTNRYGKSYWCVKVPRNISSSGEIYLYADKVELTPDGSLIFLRCPEDSDKEPSPNLALAAGSWIVMFAASVIDGSAVAVEHWEGEVIRD